MKTSHLSQILAKYQDEELEEINEFKENAFIFGKSGQYEIDVACDLKSKIEAYELVYNIYRMSVIDYAYEHKSNMWYSIFNASPNTITLIVRNNTLKKIIATLTIVIDSELSLPLSESYPAQLNELRLNNRKCAEIISLVIDEAALYSSEILIQLFKFSYLISKKIFQSTDLLIMIKPKHSLFYIKKLAFEKIGDVVICKKIKNKPVALFRLNLLEAEKIALKEMPNESTVLKYNKGIYKSFVQVENSNTILFLLKSKVEKSEMTISDLKYLFLSSKKILQKYPAEKIYYLSNMYRNKNTKSFLRKCAYNQSMKSIESGFYTCV